MYGDYTSSTSCTKVGSDALQIQNGRKDILNTRSRTACSVAKTESTLSSPSFNEGFISFTDPKENAVNISDFT